MSRFSLYSEIPSPIKQFYFEEVISTHTEDTQLVEVPVSTPNGIIIELVHAPIVTTEVVVRKLPAYYENGGFMDKDQIALWDFHDKYVAWLDSMPSIDDLVHFTPSGEDTEGTMVFSKEKYDYAYSAWLSKEPVFGQ